MTQHPVRFYDSITVHLLRMIFGLYLIVALITTIIQISVEYGHEKNTILQELENLSSTFGPGITTSLWAFDEDNLRSILKGMLKLPIIKGIQIKDEDGKDYLSIGIGLDESERKIIIDENGTQSFLDDPNELFSGFFRDTFLLHHTEGNKLERIGEVTIYSDDSVVFERVKYGFILIIINSAFKTLALWGIFIFFLRKILGRPLEELTSAVDRVNLDNLEHLKIKTSGRNELKALEEAFNTMMEKLFQATNELRESELRLRQVIDLIPFPISARDKTGKFLLANQAFAEIFETTIDQIVGKNLRNLLLQQEEVVKVLNQDRLIIENSQSITIPEQSIMNNRGQLQVSQVHKMPFNISGVDTSLSIAVDITELKQTQNKLLQFNKELEQRVQERTQELLNTQNQIKEREENLNRIIETIPLPLAIVRDSDGKYLRVNQAFLDFHKLSKDELSQFSIASNYVTPEDQTKLIEALGEQRRVKNYEVQFKRLGTGEKYWCFVSLYPITYFGESSILGVSIDITERKQMELELITARQEAETANQAKSEFLANMSHEIRTPMNAILGFSQILEKQLTDKEHKESVQYILSSGKSLLTLINDILDLSKVEAGKLELEYTTFNPHTLFEEMKLIFSLKMAEKKLEFQMEIDSELPQALILDEIRLRQILLNLLGNAVKFTETGTIKLSVSQLYTKEDHSQLDLIFSVEDTGMGISEDQIELIFAPFEQQKKQSQNQYGGTGLGLTITKRLVEMMGGHISVESQVGVGSLFNITLKEVAVSFVVDLKEPQKTAIDVNLIQFEHASILIVDDVETNRNLVKGYLASYDFNFYEAANGQEAVELAKRYLPDLILMDIKMPVLNGEEATKQLKANKETQAIPVIALTAAGMKQAEDGFLRICDGFLRKPVNRTQLIRLSAAFLKHTFKEMKTESRR